ncbi:mitochondrial arginine transporter BAC1 isoform X1 [Selaginella moellendorffii]|uniref:mitochondrial arginine transporter BAC1 isoform X1 n=1 Tax=Selaginella moellendorffii TaxID=88036 RepID=UPI000D1C8CC6|nr:mitochondrial arginine transporter BAC1 isoform X1 [Selaginella moellendorffii]|eukprot:XP_024530746.1 mitochondrial arginine transporter BAC1 isoform X1 [Selaginella moellendorffii]
MENAVKDYAAGLAAGLATVTVGHPFDTVKVNLQARSPVAHASAIRCAGWILNHEGVRGLYKGATSSFAGMAVEGSLLFGIYSQTKARLQGGEAAARTPNLSTVLPSAAFGGGIISLILCPTELVKCRLQVQEKGSSSKELRRYSGPLDCAKKTIHAGGVPGLFRGLSATFFRESVGNMCFFATYETSRSFMLSHLSKETSLSSRLQASSFSQTLFEAVVGIVSGGVSGMAFWVAVLPFDVAKTRIQTALDLSESRSLLFNLRKIRRELGFRGLYTGLGPTLVRAFPANAAAIVTWELTAKLLGSRQLHTLESSLV